MNLAGEKNEMCKMSSKTYFVYSHNIYEAEQPNYALTDAYNAPEQNSYHQDKKQEPKQASVEQQPTPPSKQPAASPAASSQQIENFVLLVLLICFDDTDFESPVNKSIV